MSTLKERLLEVMRELNFQTARELARFLGVTEGRISQIFDGGTKLGPGPLQKLSNTKFNLEWITDGRPPKYKSLPVAQTSKFEADVQFLIKIYCRSDNEHRDLLIGSAELLANAQSLHRDEK